MIAASSSPKPRIPTSVSHARTKRLRRIVMCDRFRRMSTSLDSDEADVVQSVLR